ncbi:hypothetical protein LCGC14_3155730, partial [marine sediment metagenome]
ASVRRKHRDYSHRVVYTCLSVQGCVWRGREAILYLSELEREAQRYGS